MSEVIRGRRSMKWPPQWTSGAGSGDEDQSSIDVILMTVRYTTEIAVEDRRSGHAGAASSASWRPRNTSS